MPVTPVTPPPTTPTPPEKLTARQALTDITVVLGALATVGEGVLVTLPAGPVHDTIAVALPALVALAAGLRKVLA